MTTSALIDLIINFGDNSDAADADNAVRRLRILQYSQEIFDEVWNYQEWPFRFKTGTVTITPGGNSADLPSDFGIVGSQCGLWDSNGKRFTQVSPSQLIERRIYPSIGFTDRLYAIFDYNTTTKCKKIQTLTQAAGMVFTLYYLTQSPTLADDTGATNNLDKLPEMWHQSVLVPGVMMKAKLSIGDTRNYDKDYREGLAKMWQNERPRRDAIRRLPLARRMW